MTHENFEAMLSQAVLVVAHPDDEALWFSSILGKVKRILICYLETPFGPATSLGRVNAARNYPLANTSFLGLKESGVYEMGDWQSLTPASHGIQLKQDVSNRSRAVAAAYARNFDLIKERLATELRNEQYVITHNPWGEYGHEEHIQVFRAVQSLQQRIGFTVFCSNYCSDKTLPLFREYARQIGYPGHTLPTDKSMGLQLMNLYVNNDCWTWLDDYAWPDQETFFEIQRTPATKTGDGNVLPLIFLRFETQVTSNPTVAKQILGMVMHVGRWLKQTLTHALSRPMS